MDRSNRFPPNNGQGTQPPKGSPSPGAETPSVRERSRRSRRRYETTKKASQAKQRLAAWALLHALEAYLVEFFASCRDVTTDEWIDQDHSPLGKWKHLKLVRDGAVPGHKAGKKVLIRREDLNEYLEQHAVQTRRTGASKRTERSLAPEDIAARTLAELGLELGGKDEG